MTIRREILQFKKDRIVECENLRSVFLEMTSLGVIRGNRKDFKVFETEIKLDQNKVIEKCMETVLRASYYIFARRDKP